MHLCIAKTPYLCRMKLHKEKQSGLLSFIQNHRHLFVWIATYIAFILISSRNTSFYGALVIGTGTIIPLILIDILLRQWLIPRFMQKRRHLFFLGCFLILCVGVVLSTKLDGIIFRYLAEQKLIYLVDAVTMRIEDPDIAGRLFLHAKWSMLILSTIAISSISWLLDERKRMQQLVKERHMQSELKYLRSQINPHFLFNALNCIYALTATQSEDAPDSVLKLSEMLRYVLSDCNQESVSIDKEINYLNNYIDFQRIRMEHKADIRFVTEVQDHNFQIPPMLLQPILENSFKHSRIADNPDGFVHILLQQEDHRLLFISENSKHLTPYHGHDDEHLGIGIHNVQQRLEILYGTHAHLNIEEQPDKYTTRICIEY